MARMGHVSGYGHKRDEDSEPDWLVLLFCICIVAAGLVVSIVRQGE
jgi:hypothetical protein